MHTGIFWQAIYWFSTPTLAVLVGILLWRKLPQEFPFFFAYVSVALLGDIARRVTYAENSKLYLYTFWIADLVGAVFILLATHELFVKRLFHRFYGVKFYRYLFSVAAAVIVVLGLLTALGDMRITVLARGIRTLDFLRVTVLFFFVALMIFMGRHWSRYEFGIALGLSLDAAAFLVTFAIYIKSGPLHGIIRDLPIFGENSAYLVWLITFVRPERSTPAFNAPEVLHEARRWEEVLKESLSRKKDSN